MNKPLLKITFRAKYPIDIDGLFMGYTDYKSSKMELTQEGIIFNGKLFKTFDYTYLLNSLEENGSLKINWQTIKTSL